MKELTSFGQRPRNGLGLTARQLRLALDYIEANLSQDVSFTDAADASVTSALLGQSAHFDIEYRSVPGSRLL
jgi:hypothetical protein